jgi:nitrate reductase NapE component
LKKPLTVDSTYIGYKHQPQPNENKTKNKKNSVTKNFIIVLSIVALALIGTYVGFRIWIKSDVDRISQLYMQQYQNTDKVDALILVLNSENESLKAKNDAIWALGHLRNSENALPVLKALQTGNPCDHSRFVCQRELNKTIGYLEAGNINLMKFK